MNRGIKINLLGAEAGFKIISEEPDSSIKTLKQVHGSHGVLVTNATDKMFEADWLWTRDPNCTIGIKVADCTALLVSGKNSFGKFVAAIHAGWRGTAQNIIEKAFEEIKPISFEAWLSPSICQEHFEVGEEVIEALGSESKKYSIPGRTGKYFLDLKKFQIAKLKKWGSEFKNSSLCTYCQPEFVSYRRLGTTLTTRHLAWIRIKDQSQSW
ncbi:MAG: hypothetical protein JWQ35_873 [Bacteriovoracaceae bacterium]|nr:hypothetical protein [Bacteriovoracaceae bacterium]